ncbi:hypothetical protein [Paraburkholderia sp. UCT2]|uniref:hypothetical protein n=1 Tax=Paraburkholderia sp. UCT2 TaxID=2615208 RepID=UPI001654F1B2|nr:hypothetical protein [Paraburkholderia sp. UCT2]MBC8729348.1 hypothetical protein [Paraburkholderia sp. UCT2]
MNDSLKEYYEALDRLKTRKAKINNDTVSIEAGRKKGSIKKSRAQFAELIAAIEAAAAGTAAIRNEPAVQLERYKGDKRQLQERLDESLEREIALVKEIFDLKQELVKLRGGSVLPIRKGREGKG